MRLLLDMGLSAATAEFLRGLGYDTLHLRDRGLQRATDDEIFRLAVAESRVIVTCDLDFTRIVVREGQALPSLILFRLAAYTTTKINLLLTDAIAHHAAALRAGAIVVVEPTRIRVRSLPVS
jgi:predicted nuclease of predicted toxin-antitoxin system